MLLIYLPQNSPRTQYVFDLIFSEEFGLEYRTTNSREEFANFTGEKINYSEERIGERFFIKSSGELWERGINQKQISVEERNSMKVIFSNESDDLGFDIFSAVFFMLSRYEEYLSAERDKFGRFQAKQSLAYKNDFLQKPVVNIWIENLKSALKSHFPDLQFKTSSFNALITYDVDVAYKFKGRSFGRNLGSALKDIAGFNIKNFKERIQTLFGGTKDPWDVYEEVQQLLFKNQLPSVFFFLLADKSEHDRNLDYKNEAMKQLIQQISSFTKTGIHPSFHTSALPGKIKEEKERLESISGKMVTKSRQHYLKFQLPETYDFLFSNGITEDYSMGFADEPGFRAGTCKPFYFYDLKNEKTTSLKIFPVTCMDATFIYYLEKSAEKSLMQILNLLKEVKKVNGIFIPIFHNEVIAEKSWNLVHQRTIQQIKSYLKTV